MSKSDAVREYVKKHAGATRPQIAAGTGLDRYFVGTICGQRVKAGEFVLADGGYTWNADYVRGKHGQRLPKKVRGFKAEKRARAKKKKAAAKTPAVRSMRALADKVCAPAVTPMSHLQTTLAAFDAVLNLEGAEPMLVLAYQSHREAVAMVAAG